MIKCFSKSDIRTPTSAFPFLRWWLRKERGFSLNVVAIQRHNFANSTARGFKSTPNMQFSTTLRLHILGLESILELLPGYSFKSLTIKFVMWFVALTRKCPLPMVGSRTERARIFSSTNLYIRSSIYCSSLFSSDSFTAIPISLIKGIISSIISFSFSSKRESTVFFTIYSTTSSGV